MSVDPILLNDLSPMRITPFENFVFVLNDVGFSVYSGAGYPGQGGVYYGIRGRLYVSSYRLVFVELDPSNRHFRSFSLPLYGISSSHRFRAPFFGRPTYDGIVSPVPGGGLVGPGKFRLTFQGVGFDEFRSFYEPLFEHSRELHRQMNALPNASIVQVPGPITLQTGQTSTKKIAFTNPADPFTLFIHSTALHREPGPRRSGTAAGLERIHSMFRGKTALHLRHRQSTQPPQGTQQVVAAEPVHHGTTETQRMQLQAIWQLLVTGFELTKYPNAGPARRRVMWLTLDGRLCVGRSKTDKHAGKFMHLWDVEKVQKGCESPQFSKSLSWRDAQGKEQQCWSVEARTSKKEGHSFALQVTTVNVRNILVDCLGRLVELMRGDSDGDYPRAARVRIGKHYASTGEVLSMGDVQAMMARQGSEVANIASDCEDGVVAPDVSDDSGEDDE
ncbi:hypothetical protein H310_04367 [Aphanomyces invadans]|uniref:Uncharacterized protein n=1 Tax=Aphanomyces invadans TaxID=157072 RepID=A0A024UCI4_9STRA|nr:hypothetical protein H310_04367 [Aphanomyces invadans]ETW03959.1 hypothetical protein H310_04367 [Aphanomyces invadans]|eukprot:XP_008866915.1 hypothetical protein H310_04367 [Aphanomyces invadans]